MLVLVAGCVVRPPGCVPLSAGTAMTRPATAAAAATASARLRMATDRDRSAWNSRQAAAVLPGRPRLDGGMSACRRSRSRCSSSVSVISRPPRLAFRTWSCSTPACARRHVALRHVALRRRLAWPSPAPAAILRPRRTQYPAGRPARRHRQVPRCATRSSRRSRSRRNPLCVWLLTVPTEIPSKPAVSASDSPSRNRSTTHSRFLTGRAATARRSSTTAAVSGAGGAATRSAAPLVRSARRSMTLRRMVSRERLTTVRCRYIGAACGSEIHRQRRQSRRYASWASCSARSQSPTSENAV